jgi:hypothetical protein
MGWLRSRWTVVALVPAFFLAGFGIVSALAGGSDDSEQSSAQGSAGDAAAGPATVTLLEETGAGQTSSDPGATATGDESGSGAGGSTGGGDGGGGSGAPPAPPAGTVGVDYGLWEGVFELEATQLTPAFGGASVTGELAYLGGVDCAVGLVRVRTWFYDAAGGVVGEMAWESTQSTGEGGEVTGREPLPFEAYDQVTEAAASAALRFTAVDCL